MNGWLIGASALLVGVGACGVIAMRGSPLDRLLGLQLGSILTSLALVTMAEGFGRSIYFDLAVVFTVVSFPGTLVYIRVVERWL